jgi:hypothetical protein
MLPCIVIDLYLNNQPDALIIQIYSKTLHVSGILSAHHQEFSTVYSALVSFMQVFLMTFSKQGQVGTAQEFSIVHSALVSFMQVFYDRFQAGSGWNCSSILTLLGSSHQKPA